MVPGPEPIGHRRVRDRLTVPLLLAAFAASGAACEGPPGEEPGAVAERAPAPERYQPGGPEQALSIALEAPPPAAAEPAEIYYDLTQYEWYRRGEPLVRQGRDYHATGRPARVPAEQLVNAGEYMGVRFYILGDTDRAADLPAAPADTLYVPVFDGYWLPFAAEGASAP